MVFVFYLHNGLVGGALTDVVDGSFAFEHN
jgi:hypothetical protein